MQALKARLVDDWRSAWRWFSVQLHAVATSLLLVLQFAPVMPPEVQKIIPQPWGAILTGAWALLGIMARIIRQKRAPGDGK
jgi:hypothetical protein